ncbi:MAG: hypothetical protein HQM09_18370 [Candidatus Riflebacteria bacterium]|nr:hypothetical protein [Candidatus Riflebacteria bacterium]
MFPASGSLIDIPDNYGALLQELKERIGRERLRTILAANASMILMYWDIGQSILKRQGQEGWGAHVIDRLSMDLRQSFPNTCGFSPRNLKYMRAFATTWPDIIIVQGPLAQITWYHNIALMEKLSDFKERRIFPLSAPKFRRKIFFPKLRERVSLTNEPLAHLPCNLRRCAVYFESSVGEFSHKKSPAHIRKGKIK